MTSEPIRTCVGCGIRAGQSELVRIALRNDKLVVSRTSPGRGAWLCLHSERCLDLAIKRKGFERAFRQRLDSASTDSLRID